VKTNAAKQVNAASLKTSDARTYLESLPGITAPMGVFDPANLTADKSVAEIKRYREVGPERRPRGPPRSARRRAQRSSRMRPTHVGGSCVPQSVRTEPRAHAQRRSSLPNSGLPRRVS
jgi:hypothetical protein